MIPQFRAAAEGAAVVRRLGRSCKAMEITVRKANASTRRTGPQWMAKFAIVAALCLCVRMIVAQAPQPDIPVREEVDGEDRAGQGISPAGPLQRDADPQQPQRRRASQSRYYVNVA